MPPSNSGSSEPSAGVPIPPLSPTSPAIFSSSRVQVQTASQIYETAPGRSPAQGNPQHDHTSSGLVLKGCQPGCVLNRTLSSDTLSHIFIKNNLLALGIPAAAGRKERNNNPDDSKDQAKAGCKEEVKRGGAEGGDTVGGKAGDAGKEDRG